MIPLPLLLPPSERRPSMTAWIRCVSIHFPILVALLVPQQSGERVHFGRTPSPHGERIITADAGPTPSQPTPSHATVDPIARQAGAGEGWWQAVTTQLAKEEYVVTSNPEGVGASNRAHNLRTSFKERGIELQPREGDASLAWRFGWETTRFGRPGALLAVEVARPEPDGFRVTYRRGELDEWYENSSAGLEQGFT